MVEASSLRVVVNERQEELRDRVRPRCAFGKRPQDAGSRLVVAAQRCADPVLGCRLRRGWSGEKHDDADRRTQEPIGIGIPAANGEPLGISREGSEAAADASRQGVGEAIAAIVAVLGAVEDHYCKSTTTAYEHVSQLGDAVALLHVFRDGTDARDEQFRRL